MANFTDNPVLSIQFGKALEFANHNQLYQIRKDKQQTPYIAHLLAVSSLVLEAGGDEMAAIGAALHDVVEETEVIIDDIEHLFGEQISGLVRELSEDESLPKEEQKMAYAQSVLNMSDNAILISFCDKLHNIISYSKSPELFGEMQIQFYSELIPNYASRGMDVSEMQRIFNKLTERSI